MLFLVKLVRAANDNVASMFFNATGGLVAYYWLGFAMCCLSMCCVLMLLQIHESVFDAEKEYDSDDKSAKKEQGKNTLKEEV
jgi:heme exporter protein D